MKLWRRAVQSVGEVRHSVATVDDYFTFLGNTYNLGVNQTWGGNKSEEAPVAGFEAVADRIFKASPVVYSAELIRKAVFAQAEFKFLRESDRNVYGNETLRLLERPWTGARTHDLLKRMILHADVGGNSYVINTGGRLSLLRPDWVTILLGSELEPDDPAFGEDAEFAGIMYMPGGPQARQRARVYLRDEVAHFAPMPDPLFHYRGMSWMTPVIREAQGDLRATEHKLRFFDNAATPNMVIKFDANQTVEQVRAFKELMEDEHRGLANAYKTMFLGGGADATVVGANLQQLDFAKTIGKGETRILQAAGVHPTMAGASEGLGGSSLNAGNYSQVRRLFSDVHLQDLWLEACSALEILVRPPAGSRLIVDQRFIPFLQDDQKDLAEVQSQQAVAMRQLADGGWDPSSVVEAVVNNDFTLLKHSGKLSVQLQEPGAQLDAA